MKVNWWIGLGWCFGIGLWCFSFLFWGHFQVLFTVSFWDNSDVSCSQKHSEPPPRRRELKPAPLEIFNLRRKPNSMGSDRLPTTHTNWGYLLLMYHWSGDDRWLSGVQHQDEVDGLPDSKSHSTQGEWHLQKIRCYQSVGQSINQSIKLWVSQSIN